MFAKHDFDLFRVSDALDGPLVISEDFMRCMLLYNFKDFPSVKAELNFLRHHYGNELASLLKRKQFVVCEYMDIIWAYTEISDEWAKQQYFADKACYLKSLRDNLELVHIYRFYEELEPFELLDNAFDVAATLKDLGDSSPVAWVKNTPVTELHKKLSMDASVVLGRLPETFGCLGYNFTKSHGKVCLHDGCGLSLYKTAEFDFSVEGIILNKNNIAMFNYRKIEENLAKPLSQKGDVTALKNNVSKVANIAPALKQPETDPAELVYDIFCMTQKDLLNPLLGNRKALKQVMSLFG